MILVVPQIGICFLVTNRLAELTDRHSIPVLFESAVRSAMASLRVTGHEHPYHCPTRRSLATFLSRHDPSPLNVNNNTRSFATPTAGPPGRPQCSEMPRQPAHLTSSSELPTYTVVGQQPHDAAPDALYGPFPDTREGGGPLDQLKASAWPQCKKLGPSTCICHRPYGRDQLTGRTTASPTAGPGIGSSASLWAGRASGVAKRPNAKTTVSVDEWELHGLDALHEPPSTNYFITVPGHNRLLVQGLNPTGESSRGFKAGAVEHRLNTVNTSDRN